MHRVTEFYLPGHPDILCDLISELFVEKALLKDKNANIDITVQLLNNDFIISGCYLARNKLSEQEINSLISDCLTYINKPNINFKSHLFFSTENTQLNSLIAENRRNPVASDQFYCVGYADKSNVSFLPMEQYLGQYFMNLLWSYVHNSNEFLSDGKVLFDLEYENNKIKNINSIFISISHIKSLSEEIIKNLIITNVIQPFQIFVYQNFGLEIIGCLINPLYPFISYDFTNSFGQSRQHLSSIMYGSDISVSNICFQGKDIYKIDRVAPLYARYVAKNLVKAGFCDKCELKVSYSLNSRKPFLIDINTYNTNRIKETDILKLVDKSFDFSLMHIHQLFNLKDFTDFFDIQKSYIFNEKFIWEKTDRADTLKR